MIGLGEALCNWLESVDSVHARLRRTKTSPGRPYVYPTSVLLRCYLLMLIYPPVRGYAPLHTFLTRHRCVCRLVGLREVPHRTTLMRRFKVLAPDLKARIWAMGWAFILAGYVQVHVLMADGTLHRALGPEWPAKLKKHDIVPPKLRHLDHYAEWGISPYHGWVYGYRSHVVVGLTPDAQVLPLLAAAAPANVQDNTLLKQQMPWLPQESTAILLDSNYEDHALIDAWEQTDEAGVLLRWLLIQPKERSGRPADWRQALQVRFVVQDNDLAHLRGSRMEPFFAHWKDAFQLRQVPFQGLAAEIFLLLALYAYQLLLWGNLQARRPLYAFQHLIFGLD